MRLAKPKPLRILQQFLDAHRGYRRLLANGPSLTPEERDVISRMNKTISLEDQMCAGNPEHYFGVGLSAIRVINEALKLSKTTGVMRHVLDFPCGHGRVLRYLVQQFPNAEVTAGDIDRDAVAFCTKAFGAVGVISDADFKKLSLKRKFDLIWCGSLITHLDENATPDLLEFLVRHLNPGGLLLLTTHGSYAARRIEREFDTVYHMSQEDGKAIGGGYDRKGYGYANYPGRSDYGISACSPEWIRSQFQRIGGVQEVCFMERGWDGHQDVYAFSKL